MIDAHLEYDECHEDHEDHEDHQDQHLCQDHEPHGLTARVMLRAIGLYRMTAPVRTPRCRYIPSCSEYAAEAIGTHGPGKGLWLSLRRLGRCQPFGSFGFDPVPEKK